VTEEEHIGKVTLEVGWAQEPAFAGLPRDFDIGHSTFQLETRDRRRLEEAGHE
jgi:hypothetical protein